MNSEIKRIAEMYQQETGEGLPFDGTSNNMLIALRASFRKNEQRLRELEDQDYLLRKFISEITPKDEPSVETITFEKGTRTVDLPKSCLTHPNT